MGLKADSYDEVIRSPHLSKLDDILSQADLSKKYPDRFINVVVAESSMISMCAGLAMRGLKPFAYTIAPFSLFRPFEMVRIDIGYQNLPVVIVGMGAGTVYSTLGGTHHTMEDIAVAGSIPNMTVLAPCDPEEMRLATEWCATKSKGPVYMRLGKVGEPDLTSKAIDKFEIGKIRCLKKGKDIAIFSCGLMVEESLKAAKLLNAEGINAYVINVSTIKPLKDPLICDIVNECKYFVTAENHSVIGGLGDAVASFLNENKVQYFHSKVGLNDIFAEGASTDYLMKKYQMNFESIYKTSIDLIK